MGILVNKNSRVIVQGAAGVEGQFHMKQMIEYGTSVVAGIDPAFKENTVIGIPAYTSVKEAVEKHSPDTLSLIHI